MQFDSFGNLTPYQIFEIDITSFELFFVAKFGHSKTRRKIFTEYQNYVIQLHKLIGSDFYQWINGSFVTEKLHPNDLDIVTFIDFKIYEEKIFELQKINSQDLKRENSIDAYFVKVYPEEHPNYFITKFDISEWTHLFSSNRKKENKGFIKIKF